MWFREHIGKKNALSGSYQLKLIIVDSCFGLRKKSNTECKLGTH